MNPKEFPFLSLLALVLLLVALTPASAAASWKLSYDSPDASITSLQVYNGKLYASAQFKSNVYEYDGNSWKLSYTGQTVAVDSLTVYNGKLYATTGARTLVYDGTSWNAMSDAGAPLTGGMLGVYNNRLYVAANAVNYVYIYDGNSWNISRNIPASLPIFLFSFREYAGRLYAGGTTDGLIFVYDGTFWNRSYYGVNYTSTWNISHDSPDPIITSFAVHDGKLYAGTGGTLSRGYIYVYDGTSWSLSYEASSEWENIHSFAVYDGKLHAGTTHGLLTYNGTWTANTNMSCGGINGGGIRALTVYNGKLYAGTLDNGMVCELDTTAAVRPYVTSTQTPIPTATPIATPTPTSTATAIPTQTPTPIPTSTGTPKPIPTTTEPPNKTTPTGTQCHGVATYAVNPEGKNCREFNGPCEVPRNWIAVESCLPVQQGGCNSGCYYGDSCIPFGTVFVANGVVQYCDFAKKTTQPQKNDGASCQNSYECTSNYCGDGVCSDIQNELRETRNLLEKILDFLRELFGKLIPK